MLVSHSIPCAVVVEVQLKRNKLLIRSPNTRIVAGTTGALDRLSSWIATATEENQYSFATACILFVGAQVVKQITTACA